MPEPDLPALLGRPDVRQLSHISCGALLDSKRNEIFDTLHWHEEEHYLLVSRNIEEHLKLMF